MICKLRSNNYQHFSVLHEVELSERNMKFDCELKLGTVKCIVRNRTANYEVGT